MKAADFYNKLLDGYLALLRNLNPVYKLELISKLSKSMESDFDQNNNNNIEKAFGAWDKDEDAEDIIGKIRNSRNFNRDIERM